MRYKDLLMLSALWGVCATTLGAKDVLSCPFDPRDRTPLEKRLDAREISSKEEVSLQEIKRRLKAARNYKTMHPTIKKWITNSEKYYYSQSKGIVHVLYNDREAGIRVALFYYGEGGYMGMKSEIFLNRTRWFGDDVAWVYQKEPAINPITKRPWIELSSKELKSCMRGKKTMSEEDQQFLKDVLSIINENFHYYYGMQLVDLGRDPNIDKEKLIGKFIPTKIFLFDEHVDNFDLTDYSEQQVGLYRTLGHPVYSYENMVDSSKTNNGASNCGGKGAGYLYLKSGRALTAFYFNQVDPEEVNPSLLSRALQVYYATEMLNQMMTGLTQVCEEKGVNLQTASANKTPLTQALYLVHKKTSGYVKELVTNEYVPGSFDTHGFENGVNHLYNMVPIKGLAKGEALKNRRKNSSLRGASKTKINNSKKKQRKQKSSRERN